MAGQNSFSLKMSSQESGVMSEGTYGECISAVGDVMYCMEDILNEEKYDINEHIPEVDQLPQILPEPQLQAQMPTNEEFGGYYNFHLLPDQQENTKSWTYSHVLKKVFIEMEKTLPLRIKWSPLHNGLYINAVMAFCESTHRSEAVTRCHNHIALSKREIPNLHHVLSCKHTNAIYNEINGHYSVLVPLGAPQPGADYVQMDFMFHCKNSCSTGINRRPTEVVFNLETESGEVVGRRKLLVRICSCPKRDREKDERGMREYSTSKRRKPAPGKKFISVHGEQPQSNPDSEMFIFTTKICGRENYETLKRVAHGLMAGALDRGGSHALIRPIIDEIQRMP